MSNLRPHLKNTLLCLTVLAMQFIQLGAQSDNSATVISTMDNSELVGKIVEQNDDEILFALKGFNDTLRLEIPIVRRVVHFDNMTNIVLQGNGNYHKTKGWVNSVKLSIAQNFGYYLYSSGQAEYTSYVLIRPKIGLGGGLSSLSDGGHIYGYEDLRSIAFTNYYVYGKLYLNENRRRLFIDGKFGNSPTTTNIRWRCYCDDPDPYRIASYAGSRFIQYGIGFDFARSRRFRSGISLSKYIQKGRAQYIQNGRANEFSNFSFDGVLLGFSLYFI